MRDGATTARGLLLLETLLGKGKVAKAIGMAERQAHDLVQQPTCLIQSLELTTHRPAS